MAGKGNTFEADMLKLIFDSVNIANLADVSGTDLYVSLHTADPGEAGDQTTNEVSYDGYARLSKARGTDFFVSGTQALISNPIFYPPMNSGSPVTVTHAGIGLASSGAGTLLYSASLSPSIVIEPGVNLRFSSFTITED